MKILLSCVCVWLKLSPAAGFHPSDVDYCEQTCIGTTARHTACDCYIRGNREEVLDRIVKFREEMLQEHNEKRNQIARGSETKRGFPSAANMMVLNYDLELEYIARCYGGRFVEGHDVCRKPAKFHTAGQNIGKGKSGKIVQEWFDEMKNIKGNRKSFVSSFDEEDFASNNHKIIHHFSQMMWATHRYLGCARVLTREGNQRALVVICNYAGGLEYNEGGNMRTMPIYKEGEPCTDCPQGVLCNNKYKNGTKAFDALCGKVEAVPKDAPFAIPSAAVLTSFERTISLFTTFISLYY